MVKDVDKCILVIRKFCHKSVTIAFFLLSPDGFCHKFVTISMGKELIKVYVDKKREKSGFSKWVVETNIEKRQRKYFKSRTEAYDYKREFQSSGMFLVSEDSKVNMECLSDLEKGKFKVHKDFFDYNFEDLATTSSFIIYKKK